eukprot:gene5781-7191_t
MLSLMFKKDSTWKHARDDQGCILIDADPRYFLVILNYLRHGELIVEPNLNYYGVLTLGKYFQIKPIIDLIEYEENDATSWATILEDNFIQPDLDDSKWSINRDATNSSYSLEDGRFKLCNRVYLVSRDQFNPDDGEIRVTGTWCRATLDDFFQIVTRSDGLTQGPPYFEVQNGIEFHYSRGIATVVGRGGCLPTGLVKIKKQGEFNFTTGVPVHFEIFDDGQTVSFTLWESISKTSITIETTCTNRNLLNYIVIHNREKTGSNHISYLSNIRIQRWVKTTPRRHKLRRVAAKKASNLNMSH